MCQQFVFLTKVCHFCCFFVFVSPPTSHWRELPQVSFLSRQNTPFVATKVFLSRQNVYVCCGKYLSRQKMCCREKGFVATSILLSRRKYACYDKTFMFDEVNICRDKKCVCRKKGFVATSMLLSRQKLYLGQFLPIIPQ